MDPRVGAFFGVAVVSLLSLVGVLALWTSTTTLKRILVPLVALAAGAMLGDAFLHLLPHAVEEEGSFTRGISLAVLVGMLAFFLLEKVIHWQHSHEPCDEEHIHPVATKNLVGDAFHNFVDGVIIAGAFLGGDLSTGFAVTLAVALHEIPQEMGDFAILVHAGYTPKKALAFNLLSALAAFGGAITVILVGSAAEHVTHWMMPFIAGAFIHIAASDLIPEIRKEGLSKNMVASLVAFAGGIGLMVLIP